MMGGINGGLGLACAVQLRHALLPGHKSQRAQPLPFQQHPLLKGRAVAQIETVEKVAPVEGCGLINLSGS
jgi:hypothetical protein